MSYRAIDVKDVVTGLKMLIEFHITFLAFEWKSGYVSLLVKVHG